MDHVLSLQMKEDAEADRAFSSHSILICVSSTSWIWC